MATKLLKSIKREMVLPDNGKTIIVELVPGDVIAFREKGKKTSYSVSLHNAKLLALMNFMQQDYLTKMEIFERKRKAGYKRLRKPKRPSLSMFSSYYQHILGYSRKGG